MSINKKDILARLNAGEVIIGDGGFVFELEKRGYVCAGPWTPEACFEHPEAVKQLHREFLRSGSDVMQTFTFYASDDKLKNRGNKASENWTCKGLNDKACKIAREVADEGENVLVAGGICQTPTYLSGAGKEACQAMFMEQLDVFKENKVDFMIAEYFEHIEEAEWAIESCLTMGVPVAVNMCIGPDGDMHGTSTEECAIRMAKAGAHIVGLHCHFDPFVILEGMKKVKSALEKEGLLDSVHLMCQPLGYMTPDAKKQGFIDLPEFPFGLEPRIMTRFEMHKFAREAYDLGVRYIGGCCGFQAYHIRAVAEELQVERGRRCAAAEKWLLPYGAGLGMHTKPWVRARASKDYWANLKTASGRPYCPCCSEPSQWGVTQGDEILKQQSAQTTKDELDKLAQLGEDKAKKVVVEVTSN